jgi:hypothetical protein
VANAAALALVAPGFGHSSVRRQRGRQRLDRAGISPIGGLDHARASRSASFRVSLCRLRAVTNKRARLWARPDVQRVGGQRGFEDRAGLPRLT